MNDKRQEFRLDSDETIVVVEVESLVGTNGKREVLCAVSDISANGMRIHLDQTLEHSAIHNFRIKIPNVDREFCLVGEIVWSESHPGHGFLAGVALFDSFDTDIAAWKETFSNIL